MSLVLIVEDEKSVRDALVKAVRSEGHVTLAAATLREAREALVGQAVACILLDLRLRDGDGLSFLRELKASSFRQIPIVVATAYGDSERTIEAMRDGAFEYLTKPFDLPLLLATVARATRQEPLVADTSALTDSAPSRGLIGTSEVMLAVWKVIGRAASSSAPVLITGETGTGKELVARAIHDYSSRAGQPFVAVNLAALSPTLIESELMGHEKGAFTGASARRLGRIELAGEGTLFLDEIGDLDLTLQTKLLRVLQEGTFERVGGSQTLRSSARIVAATNKAVRPGEQGAALREDLFYRLAVVGIEVPPLRMRRSDIPLLVAHALDGTPARALTEAAMSLLMAHDWPGNVRELMHVVGRAAVMCGREIIDEHDLTASIGGPSATPTDADVPELERMPLREALGTVEKRLILAALDRTGGNRSEAARSLGIARTQLYAKLEEYGLTSRVDKPPSP
jgi:two-component system, NtrC family, response regulator AtoC